jgi:hypothetical protein
VTHPQYEEADMKLRGKEPFSILVRLFLFICILYFSSVNATVYAGMTGREIMEKQKELHEAKTEREIHLMKLINKKGKVKKRMMNTYSMKTKDGLTKSMLVFTAPKDIKGTGLLTWEQKDRDDDQWLYLPATKKEKRIASSGKKNRFMGTDFAYEDMRPEDLDVHEYKLVGSETVDGQDCYVVEAFPSTPKEKKESGYSKRKLWIRKDIFFTVKIEFYNKKGRLFKVQTNRDLKNVTGTIWRSNTVIMRDLKKKHETHLIIRKRALNKPMKEDFFTLRKLKSLR